MKIALTSQFFSRWLRSLLHAVVVEPCIVQIEAAWTRQGTVNLIGHERNEISRRVACRGGPGRVAEPDDHARPTQLWTLPAISAASLVKLCQCFQGRTRCQSKQLSADGPYVGYRFPTKIISHAVWLSFRFPLSLRHVDEILAARGIDVSHETRSPPCH